jgi:hypothetical protein
VKLTQENVLSIQNTEEKGVQTYVIEKDGNLLLTVGNMNIHGQERKF